MRTETHNLHGEGDSEHEVYDMPGQGWEAVTDVPCPVDGCDQTILWYEAGWVPGYRVCMAPSPEGDGLFSLDTLRHRFLAGYDLTEPKLIRDHEMED